jgi:hypothetical protein
MFQFQYYYFLDFTLLYVVLNFPSLMLHTQLLMLIQSFQLIFPGTAATFYKLCCHTSSGSCTSSASKFDGIMIHTLSFSYKVSWNSFHGFLRLTYLFDTMCDALKFDNKFEVPVMYSTAIPEPLLRYT